VSSFTFELPTRVLVGRPWQDALLEVIEGELLSVIGVVTDRGVRAACGVDAFADRLRAAGMAAVVFDAVETNPTTTSVGAAVELFSREGVGAIVGVGGGSAIDVAKAVGMLLTNGGEMEDYQWKGRPITVPSLPVYAVPTTAGTGSEVSHVTVIIDEVRRFKLGVASRYLFPRLAVLDPQATASLPPRLAAATGLDALSHAIEAYFSRSANPFTDALALHAAGMVWRKLPKVVKGNPTADDRCSMLVAASMAGVAMDQGGLGLVHALSGPLGGRWNLHHGTANAVLLGPVVAYNLPAVAPKAADLLAALGLPLSPESLPSALVKFVADLGLPTRISELGIPREALPEIAEEALRMRVIANNPREVAREDALAVLEGAF
jgi:alcohol dehydrogenase class IV